MSRYLAQLSRPGLAACAVLTLLVVGCLGPGESELLSISDAPLPSAAVSDQVTVAANPSTTSSSSTDAPAASAGPAATVTAPSPAPAERGVQVQVGPPSTPPPATVPTMVPGDCSSWRPLVERYGMPWAWAERIMRRESGCTHALADRPSTGDLSIGAFQVNYYSSSMAAWWAENGWTWDLVSRHAEAAVAAAGALYAACGSGPWDRAAGYPCRGDGRLRTPTEMGYQR